MTSHPNVTLEELLAHAGWVHALARSLIRDPDDAADVAQEAWVSALTSPPAHASGLRAWFALLVTIR